MVTQSAAAVNRNHGWHRPGGPGAGRYRYYKKV